MILPKYDGQNIVSLILAYGQENTQHMIQLKVKHTSSCTKRNCESNDF